MIITKISSYDSDDHYQNLQLWYDSDDHYQNLQLPLPKSMAVMTITKIWQWWPLPKSPAMTVMTITKISSYDVTVMTITKISSYDSDDHYQNLQLWHY